MTDKALNLIKNKYECNLKRFTIMLNKVNRGECLSKVDTKELKCKLKALGSTGLPFLRKLKQNKEEKE